MAYDEDLAQRIRELVASEAAVTEMRMFGGLAFLVGGHMAVAVSGQGGIMVRLDPDAPQDHTTRPGVEAMVMRGRPMRGWLRVDAEHVADDAELAEWVARGVAFARSLPPKA